MFSILILLSDFSCSDWIEWQPDEKKRIRILDLLESVRKTTLRKSASSAGCTSSNAITTSGLSSIRSPKTSGASLSANEETGRALRLHHCRQHSHSLRNLSSPTGLSFKVHIYSEKASKFCKNSTLLLSYEVPVKSKVEILQYFVAFSEYMNFKHEKQKC